jgi:soluble lytic murein transglycosylase-like protein
MNTSKLNGYGRAARLLYHGAAVLGLAASGYLLFQHAGRPAMATEQPAPAFPLGGTGLVSAAPEDDPKQQAAAEYLSRRYRVASDAARQLVTIAYAAGEQVGVDPLLILAVMAVESRLNPIAESVMGAKGLMQIIPRHHADRLEPHGGETSLLNPAVNVLVGANILGEYIRRAGSIEGGLQWYNGSPFDETSQYSEKVIAEQARLRHAVGRAVANAKASRA